MSDRANESSDGRSTPTRRQLMTALAGAGVLGTLVGSSAQQYSGDTSASFGGGPMADEIGELQAKVYYGTKAERPSPGVEGRSFVVWDPGHADHGAVYYDDGQSWNKEDRQFGSVGADEAAIGAASSRAGTSFSGMLPAATRNPTGSARYTLQYDAEAQNPVMHRGQVPTSEFTNANTIDFVADPYFYWGRDGQYHGYAEIAYTESDGTTQEAIGHWTSTDGIYWTYDQPAIDTPDKHKAYPLVWREDATLAWRDSDEVLMTPGNENNNLQVWTGSAASWTQQYDLNLVDGADPTPVLYHPQLHNWGDASWSEPRWIYFADNGGGSGQHLLYSDPGADLLAHSSTSNWTTHDNSPVFGSIGGSGLAGRPIVTPDYIDLPINVGGGDMDFKRVYELTESTFKSRDHTLHKDLFPSTNNPRDWRGGDGSHHIDLQSVGPNQNPLALIDHQAGSSHSNQGGNSNRGDWNVGVVTGGDGFRQERVRAHMSSNQSVSGDNSWTEVSWDASEEDYAQFGSGSFAVPKLSGRYRVEACVGFKTIQSGDLPATMELKLAPDGGSAEPMKIVRCHIDSTSKAGGYISGVFWLDARNGHRVDVEVRQDSGASWTITTDNNRTVYEMTRVGPC